jgi:hypothetical protein
MRKQATLKELCYEYSEDDLDLEPTEWHAADCLVKIFDVYAIGFAEWYWSKCMMSNFDMNFDMNLTVEKSLEIYKKEKGL